MDFTYTPGEHDAAVLATLVNRRVKKSKAAIEHSFTGEWKEEYLFEMQLSYELYNVIQSKIAACDSRIEGLLVGSLQQKESVEMTTTVKKKKNKNAPKMDLQHISAQLSGGVNLYHIEGVSDATVLALLSETGFDVSRFPSAKHFASWLAQAIRRAANAIGNMKKGALNQFFRRIAYRYGKEAGSRHEETVATQKGCAGCNSKTCRRGSTCSASNPMNFALQPFD